MNEYLNFSSLEGIKSYLNECFRIISELESEMDDMIINIYNPKRHKLKKRRRIIKKRLKGIRANVRTLKNLLEDYTTFDRDIFLPFLREYLTIKECENYELLLDVEEMDLGMALATKTYPLNLYGDHYDIVTTDYNKEILEDAQDSWSLADIDDVDDFLSNLDDDKYICLEESDAYTLLDGLKLNEDFSSYPYLYDLATELIDMKLSNPRISDKERLENVLNDLRYKSPRKNKIIY